jgi:hypothetical protein
MDPIRLELNLDEVNLILQALGKQPFEQVYLLIQKIHQQVGDQVQPIEGREP